MKRGQTWTAAGTGYASKARPVVIVQDDRFDATDSVVVCLLTSDPTDAPLIRVPVEPSDTNGLQQPTRIMVDKLVTVRRSALGKHLGRLGDEDMVRVGRALVVFLGLAG